MDVVEGGGHKPQLPKPMIDGLGKMVGLLLRLMWIIWHIGTCMVLDSGACFLIGIMEMKRRGFYAGPFI